jgi:hypothetical protein
MAARESFTGRRWGGAGIKPVTGIREGNYDLLDYDIAFFGLKILKRWRLLVRLLKYCRLLTISSLMECDWIGLRIAYCV